MKLLFNEYVETTPDPLHEDAGITSRGALAHRERQMLSDPKLPATITHVAGPSHSF